MQSYPVRSAPVLLLTPVAAHPRSLVASIKPAPPVTPELMRSGQLHIGVRIDKARADFGGICIATARSFPSTRLSWVRAAPSSRPSLEPVMHAMMTRAKARVEQQMAAMSGRGLSDSDTFGAVQTPTEN